MTGLIRAATLPAFIALAALACSNSGTPHQGGPADAASQGEPDAPSALPDGGASSDPDAAAQPDGAPAADGGLEPDGGGTCEQLLCPTIGCAAVAEPCSLPAPDPGIYASYRKDYFLPKADYDEDNPDPVHGGRFHIAGIAAASGAVTSIFVNGEAVQVLEGTSQGTPRMEWHHVWPNPVVAGEPIWVAFHSRSSGWDSASTGQVRVETAGGTALDGTFPVAKSAVPITYVTASDDGATLLVHVKNTGPVARTVTRLLVDGRDVLAAGIACVPSTTLAPGEAALWTVPLCTAAKPGDAWTVVVDLEGAPPSVGVGRHLRPHYPIEAWPRSSECPLPGGNTANLETHLQAGFDTIYMYWGANCDGTTGKAVVNELGPALGGSFNVLIGDDFFSKMGDPSAASLITDLSAVAGFLTGDESDGEVYDDDGTPRAAAKAARARWIWSMYPEATVYNGAMTNRNVGTFAGMVDVQGIDFYVGGCPPHITSFLQQPPLRGAYDYLKNTRNNHMPGPTWLYAQGLFGSWPGQPSPSEILVQAFSVMAASGKGIMWFQSRLDLIAANQASWNAIAGSNWAFRGLRHLLREGDITGLATASGDTIVDAIRARDAIVVPVIGLKTTAAPTAASCGLASLGLPVPHFVLADQAPAVTVTIPDDMGITDVFEVVVAGASAVVQSPGYTHSMNGRQLSFPAVPLSEAVPARVIVLASSPGVRAAVEAALP